MSFTPQTRDWVAANRLWFRRGRQRRWLRWLAIAASVLIAGNIALAIAAGHSAAWAVADSGWMLTFAAVVFLAPAITHAAIPRSVRTMFAQRPSLNDPIDATWNDERIVMTGTTGHTVQPWRTLHRWLADQETVVLLPSDRMLLVLPVRALTQEQSADLLETVRRFGPAEG